MAARPVKKNDSGKTKKETDPKIELFRQSYSLFLENNPSAKIVSLKNPKNEKRFGIVDIWNDPSVAIIIPEDESSTLASDLANLYLPPRYSAIYHQDIKQFEVIWTAYKLDDEQEVVKQRAFDLRLAGKRYTCEFKRSSDRLLALANNFASLQITNSNFRNLRSFREYTQAPDADRPDRYAEPVSFWIGSVAWNDDEILKLVRHVNFYLKYYDSQSPVVEIFPAPARGNLNPQNRYIEKEFPKNIVSRELEAALLVFYSATFTTISPASNFLNLYRIIEFVSYGYMHGTLRAQIKSVLNRPSVLNDVERSSTELLMLLREAKLEREQDTIRPRGQRAATA